MTQPTASPSAAPADDTGGWASGSLAVVLPVRGRSSLLDDQLRPMANGETRPAPETWNLAGLRRSSSSPGNRLAQPNVVAWNALSDQRIASTQGNCAYLLMHDRSAAKAVRASSDAATTPPEGTPAPGTAPAVPLPPSAKDPDHDESWQVAAIELFSFSTAHDARSDSSSAESFLVLHVIARPGGLRRASEMVAYFSSTYARKDQARGRWPDKKVKALLRDAGFPTGTTWDRPYVLTHLVPDQTVPDASGELLGAQSRGWSPAQVWAWRLAGGANLTIDHEPGWDVEAPTRGGFWSGSTWCRVEARGAAFVGTRGLGELPTGDGVEGQVWWKDADADDRRRQYIEHVRLEAYVHRTAVDLTILAMRQNAFLGAHASSLVRVFGASRLLTISSSDVPGGDPLSEGQERTRLAELAAQVEHARAVVIDLEVALIEFRNELWFTHVPGDAVVTATLGGLHEALGSYRLLEEIDTEQRDIVRILSLASDEATARLARDQEDRRRRLERIITFVGPLIAVPGVVLAFVQVYQGGDEDPASFLWPAVWVISALCLVSWIVLVAVLGTYPRGGERRGGHR